MLGVNETITVDTLGLVDPEFDEHVGLLDGLLFSDKETLEDIGQVTHIELVMEVNSSLTEGTLDVTVKLESSLNNGCNQLLNGSLKFAEVLV
jgi:hypothetical protein